MGQTIAEALKDEGRNEGRQEGRQEEAIAARRQTLLMLLQKRFGPLPKKTVARIRAAKDVQQLDVWLGKVVTAENLSDLGIN